LTDVVARTVPAVTLRTLLATYANTAALKQGRVQSDAVSFDFADVRLANTAFKSLVRDHTFDVGELAIVTYLQARAYGTPYVLMPVVVVGRGQHHTIVYNPVRGDLAPADLEGRRVGVRAYTQTTGTWIRGILEEDHGVDFRRVDWVTFEEPHLREYQEPEWVTRAPGGSELLQMLMDGKIDAAIFGNEMPAAPVSPLFADPYAAAAAWSTRRGVQPINHMMVVRESIARHQPEVVREVYRVLLESRKAAQPNGADHGFGLEANRSSLELIIDYSFRQQLIPRRLDVDELFDETTRTLGV
jgi:4,5-dihydroxyphthalate decarboxylase